MSDQAPVTSGKFSFYPYIQLATKEEDEYATWFAENAFKYCEFIGDPYQIQNLIKTAQEEANRKIAELERQMTKEYQKGTQQWKQVESDCQTFFTHSKDEYIKWFDNNLRKL